jgi:hypothetical protein
MTLNSNDWKKLQTPIMLLLLMLCVAGVLINRAMHFEETQQSLLNAQNKQLSITQQKYRSSGSEKQDIITFLPQYKALIAKGFIGEERRQVWIQSLHHIQQQFTLFPIKYQLNPLEQTSLAFFPSLGNFTLHQSSMKLNFDLLHEGDILKLTEALASKQYANWLLRECDLNRMLQTQENGANLTANCTIDWFTLTEPSNRPGTQE